MKENCTIPKPHLVENFIQDLMSKHTEKDDAVIFTKVCIRISDPDLYFVGRESTKNFDSQ